MIEDDVDDLNEPNGRVANREWETAEAVELIQFEEVLNDQ